MDINDLFENIANIFSHFAKELMADQAHKNKPISGRGPERKGKDSENSGGRENQIGGISLIGSDYDGIVAALKTA